MTAVLDIALDDVTDDAIGLVSHGHKYTFALIALYKRLLQMPIKDGERFRLLQELNSMTGHEISPAGLALVDPASDPELAIIDQANQADVGNDKRSIASFDILSSSRVFRVLLKLNSGMRAAVMIGHKHSRNAAVDHVSPAATSSPNRSVDKPVERPKPMEPPPGYSWVQPPWSHPMTP